MTTNTARRYTSPVSPPPLMPRPVRAIPDAAPVLSLHGSVQGRAPVRLITFAWARVADSRLRRG